MARESNLVFPLGEYIVILKLFLSHYNLLLYAFAYALWVSSLSIFVDESDYLGSVIASHYYLQTWVSWLIRPSCRALVL